MSDELKEIELETARIKLMREQMALEDELKKRQRLEDTKGVVAGAVTGAANIANEAAGAIWPIVKGALIIVAVVVGAIAAFMVGVFAVGIAMKSL